MKRAVVACLIGLFGCATSSRDVEELKGLWSRFMALRGLGESPDPQDLLRLADPAIREEVASGKASGDDWGIFSVRIPDHPNLDDYAFMIFHREGGVIVVGTEDVTLSLPVRRVERTWYFASGRPIVRREPE